MEEAQELSWFNKEVSEKNYRKYKSEVHALIYTDGNVALTMFECCYAMFYLKDGLIGGGSLWGDTRSYVAGKKPAQYKLSEESRIKIIDFADKQPKTFKEAWSKKIEEGYQYGEDALEQVEFGWNIAKGIKE